MRFSASAARRIGVGGVPIVAGLALVIVACAPLPPPVVAPAPTSRIHRPDTLAATPPGSMPAPALADSGPSSEALEVLKTIPEPVRSEQRVAPPPDTAIAPPTEPKPVPPNDSTPSRDTTSIPPMDTTATAPGDSTSVPVPSPTFPLGLEPPPAPDTSAAASRDSALAPPAVAPGSGGSSPGASAAPPVAKPEPPRAAAPDTCWRVQIGAPAARAKAVALQRAGESLLLIPMVIEADRKLFKVRSRDCLDANAAERTRERAVGSGFKGAFRFPGKPR